MEAIRSSLIVHEVNKIINAGPGDVNFAFSAELFAGNQKVAIHRVDFITLNGDFGELYQDDISASFKIEPSVYQRLVYPNRNDLMVHLKKTPLSEGGSALENSSISIEKLRVYLKNPVNLTRNQNIEISDSQMDAMGMMEVPMQLTSALANRIRLHQCATNYRGMTPAEVLHAALVRAINENKVDGKVADPRISMLPPDNRVKRSHVILPHGKLIHELPHFLQDNVGGIYNAGIRMYFRQGTFYIWPKYYLGDRTGQRKSLTIINLPDNQYPGAERTYRTTEFQVIVISTGESRHYDTSMSTELNEGNGIRFTNSDAILNGMVVTEGNKSVMRRGFANSEFIDGETGRAENFAPVSRNRITANPFAEVSKLAAGKGYLEQFVWQNADPYAIYPGMDVKVIAIEGGRLVERLGSLVGADFHMGPKTNNFINNQLAITAGLTAFVSKKGTVIG